MIMNECEFKKCEREGVESLEGRYLCWFHYLVLLGKVNRRIKK